VINCLEFGAFIVAEFRYGLHFGRVLVTQSLP